MQAGDSEIAARHHRDAVVHAGSLSRATVRPWARLIAKRIDLFLVIAAVVVPAWLLTSPGALTSVPLLLELLPGGMPGLVIFGFAIMATALVFPLIEGVLISLTGTTPGKSLMGISVREQGGGLLSVPASLARSYRAIFYGFGLLIPLVALCTAFGSYHRLVENGSTHWDRKAGAEYVTGPVTAFRWGTGIAIILLAMFVDGNGSLVIRF